jgi:hypothetical protein
MTDGTSLPKMIPAEHGRVSTLGKLAQIPKKKSCFRSKRGPGPAAFIGSTPALHTHTVDGAPCGIALG